jgi:ankyrin repeat protein
MAADLDNVWLAHLLLEKGAEVQYYVGSRGQLSPLPVARSAEMVQLLLDYEADPDLVDNMGRPPLRWYAIRDDVAAMRVILDHAAEVSPIGSTKPLHEAAQRSIDAVELLVKHGADVEERDRDKSTPWILPLGRGSSMW